MSKIMLIAGLAQHIPVWEDCAYVGIDRGSWIAMEQHIPLTCAIGDFDSISVEEKVAIEAYTEIVTLPAHKDETDTEIAIFYALEQNYDEIYLYGGLGGRMDHTLANLSLITHRDLPIILVDEHHYICKLKKGSYQVPKRFTYLSFLALEDACISEEGVAYPLDHRQLTPKDIYPVSNEILEEYATITVHEGSFLMIQCDDAIRE